MNKSLDLDVSLNNKNSDDEDQPLVTVRQEKVRETFRLDLVLKVQVFHLMV